VRINVACPRRMLHAALEQLRRAVAAAATGDPALGRARRARNRDGLVNGKVNVTLELGDARSV